MADVEGAALVEDRVGRSGVDATADGGDGLRKGGCQLSAESPSRAGRRSKLEMRLERAERHSAELALIAEMAGELAHTLDLDAIAAVVARTAVEMTGASECAVWLAVAGGEPRQLSVATGIPGAVPPDDQRRTLLRKSLATGESVIITPAPTAAGEGRSFVALPLRFEATVLGALELAGFPEPELLAEEVAMLGQALPVATLSLQNALNFRQRAAVAEDLRRALEGLKEKQAQLEAHSEEIAAQAEQLQAQNEEIQSQAEELQSQNDELIERQRQLEAKNAEIARAHDEVSRLYALSLRQEAQVRAIVESTADGLMVVDNTHRVIAANPALERLTGFAPEALVGRACRYLVDARVDSGASLCDTACPFLHDAGRLPQATDALLTRRDGQQVWVSVTYGVIRDRDGQPTGVVHALRDISARKELEQQKDDFLSMAAHDLKNPLTSIRGNAQLLARRLGRESGRQDDLRKLDAVDRQVGRMLELIDTLLDVTRIQMGVVRLDLQATDVVAIAGRVVEHAQATTDHHRVHLRSDYDMVIGEYDRVSLERVLANLVDNAVKYSPGGGDVTVSIRLAREGDHGSSEWPGGLAPCRPEDDPNWIVVSVADDGIGIAAEAQARLFERYFRTAEASQRARGFGLGLYITRGLVEAHGGRLWLESEAGRGSTFSFALPLSEVPN